MTDLFERALAVAFDRLGTGGQMLPFALVVGEGDLAECLTIVTDRSDKAQYLGRRLVRETAGAARKYAIATDAYVRRDGERLDAVIIETCERSKPSATVLAQPYRMAGEVAQPLGDPLSLGVRPSELDAWDPHSLDWGAITPDRYVEAQKLAVHIVNHNFESTENVERTVRFLRARVRHHAPHLPEDSSQLVHYDARGQSLTDSARAALGEIGDNVDVRFTIDGTN
jgi:hypothetical protein